MCLKRLGSEVFEQLNYFLYSYYILENFQSGFWAHQSTEMALVEIEIVNGVGINLNRPINK